MAAIFLILVGSWTFFTSGEIVALKESSNNEDRCTSSDLASSSYLLTSTDIICHITSGTQRARAVEDRVVTTKTVISTQRVIRCGTRKESTNKSHYQRILSISRRGKPNTVVHLQTGEIRTYINFEITPTEYIQGVAYIPSRQVLLVARRYDIWSYALFSNDGKPWKKYKYSQLIACDDIHKFVFVIASTKMMTSSYSGQTVKRCTVSNYPVYSMALDETSKTIYLSTHDEIFKRSYDCVKRTILQKRGKAMVLDNENGILYYEDNHMLKALKIKTHVFVMSAPMGEHYGNMRLLSNGGEPFILQRNALHRLEQDGNFSRIARIYSTDCVCLVP